MVLKWVSSQERVTVVTHRRVLKPSLSDDDDHTRPAPGIAQGAPSKHAQLLHVDSSRLSGNRMYTETGRYEMFTLSEMQITPKDTS